MTLLDLLENSHQKVLRVSGGCHNCPKRRRGYVPAELVQGLVLFVGGAPSQSEVATGLPFSGSMGQALREYAAKCNVPTPWSFTYVAHCGGDKTTPPTPKEVGCCLSQFVLDEIRDYPVIALIGNSALQAFFPGAKFHNFTGNVARHPDFPAQRFYYLPYPPFKSRKDADDQGASDNKGGKRITHDDYTMFMLRLARLARGEMDAVPWTLHRGAAGAKLLRKLADTAPLLSIDFETSGLEMWKADGRIQSLAVTADGKNVVVAHESEPQFRVMLDTLAEFVSKPEKSIVGHHVGFDMAWLRKETGVSVACTVIYETSLLYYEAKQYKMPSLKELVSRELDGYRFLVYQPHTVKDVDLLLNYNAEDVIYPLDLLRKGMRELKPKTRDLVGRVLGPVEVLLMRTTATGFHVREAYRQEKITEYAERRRRVLEAWHEEDPEFIPTVHESGDGLLTYLYDMRKLPVIGETSKGQASTDKSILKELVRQGHSIVRHLLELREIDKTMSTYLVGYDKALWPDSRVRSSYSLSWTDSGRSSSRQPNLQNIPRNKAIRNLFGVPAGHVLMESDLSQIEFRIMVCLAQDENGIAGYLRGDDAHTMTARNISGVEHPTSEQRSNAKPVNFMFLYGGQAATAQKIAADDYGVIWTLDQAQNFRAMFMATYPRVPIFHEDRRRNLIANRGWFESRVGHVFHYADWDSKNENVRDHAFRAALNAEAQGPAAHICFYIMTLTRRMLDERGMGAVEVVNTVHDSMLLDIPKPAWVDDVVATITEAVQIAHAWVKDWFVVPLIMEHKVGESWGAMQDYGKH